MRETIRILEGIWGDDGGDGGDAKGEAGSTKRNYRRHNDAAATAGRDRSQQEEGEDKSEVSAAGGGAGAVAGAAAAAGAGGKRQRHGGVGAAIEEGDAKLGDSDVFAAGGGHTTGDNADVPVDKDEGCDGAEPHSDDHLTPGAGTEAGPRRGDVALAEGSGKFPAGGGEAGAEEGEGDAGVDAWLISYNRRLKNELERLRGRTRKAEDR